MSDKERQRFRLVVAYDGRPFDGWQSQAGGNTVQDRLLAALREISKEIGTVQGSGRTDAGVSALAQVAHFDAPTGSSMDSVAWLRALNTKLPPTIRVMDCDSVPGDFHSRFSALEKTYRYRIWTGSVLPPLKAGLVWHLAGFDGHSRFVQTMKRFEGTHDFRAFSANRRDGRDEQRNTERTLSKIVVNRKDCAIVVTLTGNGFLYKMVRFLVGAAVWAARDKISEEGIECLLNGSSESVKAPFCAPADGLCLVNVRYDR
jgi:tRNA pseudouridine38-40 synthase